MVIEIYFDFLDYITNELELDIDINISNGK